MVLHYFMTRPSLKNLYTFDFVTKWPYILNLKVCLHLKSALRWHSWNWKHKKLPIVWHSQFQPIGLSPGHHTASYRGALPLTAVHMSMVGWPISVQQRLRFSSDVPVRVQKCVPERVWLFQWLCQGECRMSKIALNWPNIRSYGPTIVLIIHFWTTVVPQRVHFLWICASKGMDLGPNFVPVKVGFHKFCATEDRGFTVPS